MQFRNLSIRHKLVVILLLLAAFSLVVGFGVHVAQDVSTFKNDQAENAGVIAKVIGEYCVADLAFGNYTEAEKKLAKLSADPNVDQACLYDSHGNLFAQYNRQAEASCAATPNLEKLDNPGDQIVISELVSDKNQIYGRINLYLSTELLRPKFHKYFNTLLLLAAALMMGSFLLALWLQRVISRPILELANTTRTMSERQDYSMRLQKSSEDEIGRLCDEFNNLLQQVERGKQQRDEAEQALRESENRYRVLVESSPQAVFLEQRGGIIYANAAALRLYGCPSIRDMRGKLLSDLFPNWNIAIKKQRSGPVEHVLIRSDGNSLPVEASFIVTVFQGETALQVLAWDVTEKRNMRQAAERVERLAAVGEFSAILAHEIRNSLGAITLSLKTLSERVPIPEAHKKTFDNIELGTQRIQDIIKGILDFARPAPPSLRKVGLHRVLDNSIRAVEGELDNAGIQVARDYETSDPEMFIDPGQIGQVFVNLLLNAKHAMQPGGKITISTRRIESAIEVKVTDTGKGIASQDIDRIFDPFFTTTPAGAGLGLAFVARILEQHNASIFVESKVGVGTTFTIQFNEEVS